MVIIMEIFPDDTTHSVRSIGNFSVKMIPFCCCSNLNKRPQPFEFHVLDNDHIRP